VEAENAQSYFQSDALKWQKEKAERIAKKINGVKSVVNNLKVEKP
jgi:osmotically-inducible protein OsmY